LDLTERKSQEDGKLCIKRNFIIYALIGLSNQGGRCGWDM